jgi:hypothetical protein
VIAIFTKFDDLITQVWKRRLTMDANRQQALTLLEAKFEAPLRGYKFPPRAYLCLESASDQLIFFRSNREPFTYRYSDMQEDNGKHEDQVKELKKKTADSLDDLAIKMLFVSVQQNNLELCISYAVKL